MATVMNRKENKGYCDEVFTELSGMKQKIIELRSRSLAAGTDIDGGAFSRHLSELVDQIDWKLQILSHSCAYDWAGSMDYEGAQVEVGKVKDNDFSPGYLGG